MDFNFIPLAFGEAISPTTAAYALATIGLVVHFGFTGLVNFGQAGFMAIGGYAFVVTSLQFHWPLPFAILATIVCSVIFAFLLGLPTLRLRADYLSIVTIAAAEIVRLSVKTPELTGLTGGATGLNGGAEDFQALNPFPNGQYLGPLHMTASDLWAAICGWALVLLACLLVWALMRSPWGRIVKGIREDEDAVRALGKNVFSYKMQALVLGGVLGGLAGALFILPRSLQPDNYGTQLTFFLYTIMLLGGATTIFGPLLGAAIFWVVLSLSDGLLSLAVTNHILPITSTQQGPIRFIIVGLALMLLVIFRPQGILGKKAEVFFRA
ncbi:branched-chain amino acid ABC transporter permease [Schumannella sp. 10F1B-5-1]|uniref:branched-chain amino acid ABC transporter permease n=1 Tax=Schumannella sp. 10F1B-5-1 TaxID=2590780 RepID=UPI00113286CE|nr:branched-chain amino acid ABC transporter permease [Schumannella sp. 10F1B-5-1]TPW71781.1 branched-chain amino acid ABC transporter permease [Schumannella sp. 10F1B-5-1]